MKEIALNASVRTVFGKGPARQARMAGKIPAITYGPEIEAKGMEIDAREFKAAMRSHGGASAIFSLTVDGKENKAILREIQRDPVTSDIIHLDFLAISMNKPIHMSVPVHYVGTPQGVKVDGGIMQVVMREIELSCLPSKLPEFVEVNVEELSIGESVHVSDIKVADATILAEDRQTMVVISAPTVVKTETVEGEEGEEGEGEESEEGAEGDAPAEGGAEAAPADGDKEKGKDKGKEKK